MKLIGYYAWHSLKNVIKKLFRSKVVIVVACCIGFAFIFGLSAGFIENMVEKKNAGQEEQIEEVVEDVEEEPEDPALAAKRKQEMSIYIEAGIFVGVIVFILWGIYAGNKNGGDIFMMADVNFLFTAPIKPQSVLMFRLALQMCGLFVGSLYILFQVPNLMINLKLSLFAVIAIFLGWMFLLFIQSLFSVLTYTVTTTHEKLKPYVLPFIGVIGGIVILLFGVTYLANGRDFLKAVTDTYGAKAYRFIPISGWYKGMVVSAIDGKLLSCLLYMLAIILGMALMVWFIWSLKADFYEDAVNGASAREAQLVAAKEGRKERNKERSDKITRNETMRGMGADTFFWKEVYNRRRFSKFGFVTNTMLVYLIISVLFSLFAIYVVKDPSFSILGIVIAVIVFFRNYGNPIASETSKNWLFLVPDSPYKKVFFAMISGTYACTIDTFPALVIGYILMPTTDILEAFLWFVMIVTMDFMLSGIGMFLEAIFPATAMDVVKGMLQFMGKFLMIAVIAIVITLGYLVGGFTAGLILEIIVNIAVGGAVFALYPALLHGGLN